MTQEQVNRILAEFEGWKFDGIQYLTSEDMKVMIDSCPQYTTDWNDFHRVFRVYALQGGFLMKFHELLLLDTPLQAATRLAATRLAQIINDAAIH